MGFGLGLVGGELPLPPGIRTLLMTLLIGVVVVADLVWLPRRVGPLRQVNDQWLGVYRGWVAGVGFGVQLGLAVATVVISATTYVVIAAMILVGDPSEAALIGALYGGVRAASVLPGGVIKNPRDLARADRLLTLTDGTARFVVAGATGTWLLVALALTERS